MNFHEYVRQMGVDKIASLYSVTTVTARSWRDLKSAPTPEKANEIIEKSHGLISWESVYAPYFTAQKTESTAVA